MVEITSTEMTPPTDDSREFRPMRGISNRHLQTMLPRLIRRKVKFDAHWQRLELPDGDFVDLAWSEDPQQAKHKPRLVVFHGLEGSLNSPYAHGLIEAAQKGGKQWVDYRWPNATTKAVEPKSTYVEKVGDVLIGVGIYK